MLLGFSAPFVATVAAPATCTVNGQTSSLSNRESARTRIAAVRLPAAVRYGGFRASIMQVRSRRNVNLVDETKHASGRHASRAGWSTVISIHRPGLARRDLLMLRPGRSSTSPRTVPRGSRWVARRASRSAVTAPRDAHHYGRRDLTINPCRSADGHPGGPDRPPGPVQARSGPMDPEELVRHLSGDFAGRTAESAGGRHEGRSAAQPGGPRREFRRTSFPDIGYLRTPPLPAGGEPDESRKSSEPPSSSGPGRSSPRTGRGRLRRGRPERSLADSGGRPTGRPSRRSPSRAAPSPTPARSRAHERRAGTQAPPPRATGAVA